MRGAVPVISPKIRLFFGRKGMQYSGVIKKVSGRMKTLNRVILNVA
jgi:hypothetical protein